LKNFENNIKENNMKKIILITILSLLSGISFAQENNMYISSTNDPILDNAMNQAKNQTGVYNSKVSNPFVFCSAPKPGKRNPMRAIWEQICPAGHAQAAAAPVPVPIGNPPTDTKVFQEQFNKMNSTN
jgi:hypothetical protein